MTLSYRIVGEGPPILMIHGMGVPFSIWENLVPELSPYYKCIMVEQLGHGASAPSPHDLPYYAANADAIERLRRKLDIERWDVLGYSVGAWTAIQYTQCNPERVGHLALLCPAILPPPSSVALKGLNRLDRGHPDVGTWIITGWRLQWLVRLLAFAGKDHPYAHVWMDEITHQPVDTIKSLLHDLPCSRRADIVLPPIPQLFIWARTDIIVPRPLRAKPYDRIIPGGHSAPMISAPAIARELLSFVKSS